MYPIELERFLNEFDFNETILFISCISFEERSIAACNKIIDRNLSNIDYLFINLIDNENDFKDKSNKDLQKLCEMNKKNWFSKIKLKNKKYEEIKKFNLIHNNIEEKIWIFFEKEILARSELQIIIFDITCFTKSTYITLLELLLTKFINLDLIVLYTQPGKYGKNLKSHPMEPDYNFLYERRKKKLIWIPILGFKPKYVDIIWEIFATKTNLLKVIPVLGFPAFRPDIFDKSLLLHGLNFQYDEKFKEYLESPLYAEADNPFNVYYKLKHISDEYPDHELVISPLGSKPMSLGACIFAIKNQYPIFSIKSKVYFPSYSIGTSKEEVYIIRRNGTYTF